jgi:hypothetical protein
MFSRWRAVLVAVALTLTLAALPAPAAMAAPKSVQPHVVECSAYRTVAATGWIQNDYLEEAQVRIERLYTPGGADCNSWRAAVQYDNYAPYSQTMNTYVYLHRNGYGSFYGAHCGPTTFPPYTGTTCRTTWVDLHAIQAGCGIWQAESINEVGHLYSPSACV